MIPNERATVIEFLNTKMHDIEVYGVEVRRYGIGATAAAQAEKRNETSLTRA